MFVYPTGRLIAVLSASVMCCSVFAGDTPAQLSVVDMRDAAPDAVKRKAASLKPKGLALVYSGPDETRSDIVREIAAQCSQEGHPLLRVILAKTGSGDGAILLDGDGEPIGAMIPASADLRGETHARLALITDPLDVVHCRLAPKTGSNLRRQKVCTTPREDAARERGATEWTRRRQDGAMTEPAPGQ